MQNQAMTLEHLIGRCPALASCREDILRAFQALENCYRSGGKVLICGNGGSAADAEHLVAELMKPYSRKRPLPDELRRQIKAQSEVAEGTLGEDLQGALPAIALGAHSALLSAISNDMDPSLVFAQQVLGYGRPGDVVVAISTSGRSVNVLRAVYVARAMGLESIGFTGGGGGQLRRLCSVCICVPAQETAEIQELHLPIYHALCQMLEDSFWPAS